MNFKQLWQQIVGVFLLIPPILSVVFFLLANTGIAKIKDFTYAWTTGDYGMIGPAIYLGLMAIAGAYLIKQK